MYEYKIIKKHIVSETAPEAAFEKMLNTESNSGWEYYQSDSIKVYKPFPLKEFAIAYLIIIAVLLMIFTNNAKNIDFGDIVWPIIISSFIVGPIAVGKFFYDILTTPTSHFFIFRREMSDRPKKPQFPAADIGSNRGKPAAPHINPLSKEEILSKYPSSL